MFLENIFYFFQSFFSDVQICQILSMFQSYKEHLTYRTLCGKIYTGKGEHPKLARKIQKQSDVT